MDVKKKIACHQILLEDSSVFSIQSAIFPYDLKDVVTAEYLLRRYLQSIKEITLSAVIPVVEDDSISFSLFGIKSLSLITFLPTIFEKDSAIIRICGGILVQKDQCDRGELLFSVKESDIGLKVTLQLSDYCPMLLGSAKPSAIRRFFYKITQSAIHKIVTVKFLAKLYEELTGITPKIEVVSEI